ncbi:MAG: glycosyltransferase, partial [Acetobacteraceae bacterium]
MCVCTRDRPAYLRDCLNGLRFQTAPPGSFEVVVVDSASAAAAAGDIGRAVVTLPDARLIRLEQPGVSLARNTGAEAAATDWIAYLDDDAIPAPDWIAQILAVIGRPCPPALFGGRILPLWEAPLPAWWPARLRGVLSLIEYDRACEYHAAAAPGRLEPYAANMVVHRAALRATGGFRTEAGRYGAALLSDEEVQLAWRLQAMG